MTISGRVIAGWSATPVRAKSDTVATRPEHNPGPNLSPNLSVEGLLCGILGPVIWFMFQINPRVRGPSVIPTIVAASPWQYRGGRVGVGRLISVIYAVTFFATEASQWVMAAAKSPFTFTQHILISHPTPPRRRWGVWG